MNILCDRNTSYHKKNIYVKTNFEMKYNLVINL